MVNKDVYNASNSLPGMPTGSNGRLLVFQGIN